VGLVLGGGLVGLGVALVLPWFALGLALGVAVWAGTAAAYVVHRNRLVTPPLRVLTAAHWARLRRRVAGRGAAAPAPARPEVTFAGYDAIPRRLEADSFDQQRANLALERLMVEAAGRGASAMGVVVRGPKAAVRFRVGEEVVRGEALEPRVAVGVIRALKRLADLDPAETRRPQEGRLQAIVAGRTFDLRVQTAGTVRGEQAVVRLRDQAAAEMRLEDLGLGEEQLLALREALDQRPSLVVVSAPKKAGLTTTLHACLRHFDRYVHNVVAFEPEVDVEVENVEHVALDQEDGPVAAAEVRSRLHLEPDVVVFDALYEPEVARVLLEGAGEGTLVVGLRAGDATQALARLAQLAGGWEAVAPNLQVVLNQRLVRLLCPECKEAYRPNPEFLRKANLAAQPVDLLFRPPTRTGARGDQAAACPRCRNHRYVGRTAIFELMRIDEEGRRLLAGGALPDLRAHCRKLGMRNLQDEGLRVVIEGRTSVEEVLRAIKTD